MKLILDLPDDLVANINGYCSNHNVSPSDVIGELFNRYIQHPAEVINEVINVDGDLNDFDEFGSVLKAYIDESIQDVIDLSKSSEAIDTDKQMAEVLNYLSLHLIKNSFLLTELYKVYRKEEQ